MKSHLMGPSKSLNMRRAHVLRYGREDLAPMNSRKLFYSVKNVAKIMRLTSRQVEYLLVLEDSRLKKLRRLLEAPEVRKYE